MIIDFKAGVELVATDVLCYTASGDCSAHAHQRGDKLQIVCFHVLDQLYGLRNIFEPAR
jgi:hypothetical protein